jgi:hypothetical protein
MFSRYLSHADVTCTLFCLLLYQHPSEQGHWGKVEVGGREAGSDCLQEAWFLPKPKALKDSKVLLLH